MHRTTSIARRCMQNAKTICTGNVTKWNEIVGQKTGFARSLAYLLDLPCMRIENYKQGDDSQPRRNETKINSRREGTTQEMARRRTARRLYRNVLHTR